MKIDTCSNLDSAPLIVSIVHAILGLSFFLRIFLADSFCVLNGSKGKFIA